MLIELRNGTGDTTNSVARYLDLDLPANVSVQIVLTPQSFEDLHYDQDGNGSYESAVAPTVHVSGSLAEDSEAPTITSSQPTVQTQVQVTLSAQDAGAGVKSLRYSLDGTLFDEYTAPLLVDPAQVPVVYAFADDNVGNRSATFEVRLSSGLVAAYSFDEGSGTVVNDTSGYGNNGTLSDSVWTTDGKYGGALSFYNQPVVVPDSDSLDLRKGMTLMAWVSNRISNDANVSIIKKIAPNPEEPVFPLTMYELRVDSDTFETPGGSIRTDIDDGGYVTCYPVFCLNYTNEWTHLAITYDGSGLILYVDGDPIVYTPVQGLITTSDGSLLLDNYFEEQIDEVRIYNRALTQNEIQTDMSTPIGNGTLPTPTPVTPTPVTPTPVTPTPVTPTPVTPTPETGSTLRLNTGGSSVTTGGVAWAADQFFDSGVSYSSSAAIANTTDDVLYQTERYASTDQGPLNYAIPLANGSYTVRLHFAELYFTASNKRVFSANLEGGPVELQNYDIYADVGKNTAVVKSYPVTVSDGALNIAFTSSINRAKINAIEIVPSNGSTPTPVTPTPVTPTATSTATVTPTPTPGGGNTIALPGRVEAEDYRAGGEGVGYHDTTTGNTGGAYRTDDVDIETCTDGSGCHNVGWTVAGEWLQYDVMVAGSGSYTWQARVATTSSGKTMHLEVDGQPSGGTLTVPNTGGWQTWATVTSAPVTLTAGAHTLRIVFDSGNMNLNYVDLVASTPTPTPDASTRLRTVTLENTSLTDSTTGFSSTAGTVQRSTSSPLKGTASFAVPNTNTGYGTINIADEDDIWVTAYVRLTSIPGSARIVRIVNNGSGGSVTAGNLSMSSGKLTLRNGSATIGSGVTLAANTVYRVGIHQQRGSGSTNGVLEAYVVAGDAPFGAPFASSTNQSITSPVKRIEVGATNSVTLDATFDDIAMDTAAFAAP